MERSIMIVGSIQSIAMLTRVPSAERTAARHDVIAVNCIAALLRAACESVPLSVVRHYTHWHQGLLVVDPMARSSNSDR